ncbi:hypothetical protein SRS16P2_00554 (plasmid) [Variovorax sp. SRS16]|uniref:hypothetical protein n=1 Tax=Variovorax sp. SRS16 TaxID=282217 RepID=UPI0013161B46|nr:hypothetical protein [Variovorax sp. SRS16]VTU46219.1 hypothetical protein SRS16P2_00554 [Variovorax sp. SRS16]
MWLRAGNWEAAAQAVATIESWRRKPAPLAWMAEARLHLLGLRATWPLLAELGWLSPALLEDIVQRSPDPLLPKLMRSFEANFDASSIYLNQVLARAEVDSGYKPARKLWARTRNGHYLPNPAMQLRRGDGWQPVYEALKLDWVDRGTGTDDTFRTRPALAVARASERMAGRRARVVLSAEA